MRSFAITFIVGLFSTLPLWGKGGDSIRSEAPVTALWLDARDGNDEPLKKAYFEDEIDYFLDIEAPRSSLTRELAALREAGRLIDRADYAGAEQRMAQIRSFPDELTYMKGAIAAARGQYPQSLEYFRQLIDKRTDLSQNLSDLALMGAARVFHEVKDYKQAIYHYNQIGQLHPLFFQSIFEKGWSFYLMGDMNGALGATLAFMSPYADELFYPESLVVRAAAFFQLCYFERASLTVEKLKREFEPLRVKISQFLSKGPQTWLFDESQMQKLPKRITASLVAKRDFRTSLRAYLALRSEASRLRGQNAQAASRALQFVKARMVEQARGILEQNEKILRDILAQADIIQIEILQSGANLLMGQTPEHQVPVKTIDLGDVDFDEKVQFWPFKSEWWVDELGSYYYGLKSNCE